LNLRRSIHYTSNCWPWLLPLLTQCPYCIALRVKTARAAGATGQMLAETATVAAAMRAGVAITHAKGR
jgi:alkylhydroperoxidase/carboxymuconolactone decarboxylase family protein YurZ